MCKKQWSQTFFMGSDQLKKIGFINYKINSFSYVGCDVWYIQLYYFEIKHKMC